MNDAFGFMCMGSMVSTSCDWPKKWLGLSWTSPDHGEGDSARSEPDMLLVGVIRMLL